MHIDFFFISEEFRHVEIQLNIDSLIMVSKNLSVTHLYEYLLTGIQRNFTLNKNNLLHQLKNENTFGISYPKTYHFLPSNLGHFVSVVYSSKQTSDELSE